MNTININKLLNREQIKENLINLLQNIKTNKYDMLQKKGIYIYGSTGVGKTEFVMSILKELNYDVVRYDAGDIRNKSIIELITQHNMSDKSIIGMFKKKENNIAIVMDEIDGMNNGDKGGINALIKLIRPKKTKKQKKEDITLNPIICISNYHIDKKIKELMKVCTNIEIKTPTNKQIQNIIELIMPDVEINIMDKIITYVNGDLRKIDFLYNIYKNDKYFIRDYLFNKIYNPKTYNQDTKDIIQNMMNKNISFDEHSNTMNETDRTIIGLLWHENIIDNLSKLPINKSLVFYDKVLQSICFADYIDRITFQKQIWQFNEMSSLMKTMYPNKIYHETFSKKPNFNPIEVRFTKVLTKYSTEYNNYIFIQYLTQQLNMDKKDIFNYFYKLFNEYDMETIIKKMDVYDINKLDIQRIYRYIYKYIDEEEHSVIEEDI